MRQKKILILVVLALIVTIKCLYTIVINDKFINQYSNKVYNEDQVKKLFFLNIQEPYIAHYNYGNVLYQNSNYEEAKSEYEEALKTVTDKRVCDVRVNLSLTEIQLIDTEQSAEQIIKDIESIQSILTGNSCAKADGNGTDKKAQNLYDYLEELKKSQSQSGGGSGEGGEGEDPDNPEQEVIENEEGKINQIRQRREEASGSRNPSRDVDYNIDYDGVVW